MSIVCIEGLPGAGKDAVARHLHQTLSMTHHPYRPNALNLTDVQGDPARWSFFTQMRILADRCKLIKSFDGKVGSHCVVGSPMTDIHCHAALSQMPVIEYNLYLAWARVFEKGLPEVQHVFIDSDTEAAFSAVVHSGKREEAHITSKDMICLHSLYKEQMKGHAHVTLPYGAQENDVLLQGVVKDIENAQTY